MFKLPEPRITERSPFWLHFFTLAWLLNPINSFLAQNRFCPSILENFRNMRRSDALSIFVPLFFSDPSKVKFIHFLLLITIFLLLLQQLLFRKVCFAKEKLLFLWAINILQSICSGKNTLWCDCCQRRKELVREFIAPLEGLSVVFTVVKMTLLLLGNNSSLTNTFLHLDYCINLSSV